MADVFYKDYSIENVMKFMLMSDWFYDEENLGNKIKSPIEFLVGIKTLVPTNFKKPKQLIYMQRLLGQTLLDPPNVAGWKGGRNWIDSNTIVLRLKLPSLLLNSAYISNVKNGNEDVMVTTKKSNSRKNMVNALVQKLIGIILKHTLNM
ncbi:probable signal peptide protein [Jejuia pallidilutea]|uniref:Probable signal peptide protein n=2 Tax=Jejuia pallidilutea TaxID=504487 RepID=A0A090VZN4_9FLAO|nr:probable signal peptide protein [Jejuia pallidilutea]